jgi:lactoylglutathione lyase
VGNRERTSPTFAGVAHIRLNVVDVDRSVAWYREVLGFGAPYWHLGQIAVIRHPDSQLEIVLRPRGTCAETGDQVFDHVAFRVESLDDLREWEARLQAKGLEVRVSQAVGGFGIDFLDPDGNDLELFVAMP